MWQDPYGEYSTHDYVMEQWINMQWQQHHWQQWAASQWYDPGYQAIAASSSSGTVAARVQEQQNTEEETKERLLKIKEELENLAWNKLQNALQIAIANEIATELSTCIERAIFFFDYQGTDSTPRGAVDALRQTTQALDMCGHTAPSGPLYTELDGAAKKVRDTLSVRTQLMALPMGDKKKYQSVLEAAYGGRIDDEENLGCIRVRLKSFFSILKSLCGSNSLRIAIRCLETSPLKTTVNKHRIQWPHLISNYFFAIII